MNHTMGITGQPAPEFRFNNWLANVDPGRGLTIAGTDEPVIYLFNFQSWCPGCHSHGFPTVRTVKESLETSGHGERVKFIAVQTVFEGYESNTTEAALESVERHGLTDIALGHDAGDPPTIMIDYRTGGTPWVVLIGPVRTVLFDGFQIDGDAAATAIRKIIDEVDATS